MSASASTEFRSTISHRGVGSAVSVEAVSKAYGRVPVLSGLSVEVAAGEFAVLTGANGAGKTTLLRIIAGLTTADRGTVRVCGHDSSTPAARARLGFVGHDSLLYSDLTVRENLLFASRLAGLSQPATRVARAVELTRCQTLLDRPVRVLSRGMRQRAALARALLGEAAVLLLDEPYTGLDVEHAGHLSDVLATAHAGGTTIVAALHDLTPVRDMAVRMLTLRAGRIGTS